jgi:hypothetical protein
MVLFSNSDILITGTIQAGVLHLTHTDGSYTHHFDLESMDVVEGLFATDDVDSYYLANIKGKGKTDYIIG